MKPPHRRVRQNIGMVWLAVAALAMTGCETHRFQGFLISDPTPPLQIGQGILVVLTGTPEVLPPLSLTISEGGTITLPLILKPITAVGRTPSALEGLIKSSYVQNNYTTVNATVMIVPSYYYISGELNPPGNGKQLYTGRVTVLGAINDAGGFSDFADRKRVLLTRQDGTVYVVDCVKAAKDAKLDPEVLPGDKIFVDKQSIRTGLIPR
jgi:protein involved in polysaccharide export with SLBB domain